MYKAIKEIGEYKVGDEVPADKAEKWLNMYAEAHVELVSDKSVKKVDVVEKAKETKKESVVEKIKPIKSKFRR